MAARYSLVRPIGRGGMAEIWRARASGPGGFVKWFAIKMILPDLADDTLFASMFADEARLAATLVHPNVVQVTDFGELDGRLFLAMEYVAGSNLDRLLGRLAKDRRTLPTEVAIYVALEACKGLGYVHAKTDAAGTPLHVVHRDVSPQNVLVSADGDVKVGDFGIAKAAMAVPRTQVGHVRGKLAYMSPEQLENRELDGRADLFALGIVLYEMLSGRRLFAGKSSEELVQAIHAFDPETQLDPKFVPPGLHEVLAKLLLPERAHRHADAGQLERDLVAQLSPTALTTARKDLAAIVREVFADTLAADAQDELGAQPSESLNSLPTVELTAASTPTNQGEATVATPSRSKSRPIPKSPTPLPPSETTDPRRRKRAPFVFVGLFAIVAGAGGAVAFKKLRGGGAADHHGGMLRIAVAAEAEPFDVFSVEESRTRFALGMVLERFLQIAPDGSIQPWLIERHEITNGGKLIELQLHDGVWFHDNPCLPGGAGRIATADDVAYSLRIARAAHQLDLPIDQITTDGLTTKISLSSPAPYYEAQLSEVRLLPHELEGCEDLRRMKQPVGTGPFRFAAPPKGVRMELARAPKYWHTAADGSQLPYVDGIEIQAVDDIKETMARAGRGELDMVMPYPNRWEDVVTLGDKPALAPRFAGLPLEVAARTSHNRVACFGLFVGTKPGPLQNKAMRHALAMALDRDALIKASVVAMSGPNNRYLDSRMLGYDAMVQGIPHDPAAAEKLVREGWSAEGWPITIGTIHQQAMAQLIVKQAHEAGIEATVVDIAPARAGHAFDTVDALLVTDIFPLYDGESTSLIAELSHLGPLPELEKLNLELLATPDRPDRGPIYHRIEVAMLDELPMIPIAWGDVSRPMEIYIVSHNVHGFFDEVTGAGSQEKLAETWLER